jgi:hypothetical protein
MEYMAQEHLNAENTRVTLGSSLNNLSLNKSIKAYVSVTEAIIAELRLLEEQENKTVGLASGT